MSVIGTVESLWRYPVKSMRGEELAEVFVGFGGIEGDRRFAFHSTAAPPDFPFFTARQNTSLLQYRPRLLPNKQSIEVETPSGNKRAIDDPELINELRAGLDAQHQITLMRSNRSFADAHAISLMSMQTVQQLAHETGLTVDKRQFRESIYADLPDTIGFAEDGFVGRSVRIGHDLVVGFVERDQRCMLINLHPDTSQASPALLKAVAQHHNARAGIYGEVLREGAVRVGDPIALLD
jgi:hypothetical protein